MRILILTSCTGEKLLSPPDQLTMDDFRAGTKFVREREKAISSGLVPTEQLYTGMQHRRLMRGVAAARQSIGIQLDLWVLSAGYGWVPGHQPIAPYEATFTGMGTAALQSWANTLRAPERFLELVSEPYDVAFVLLGENYLQACAIAGATRLAGQTVFLCGGGSRNKLPDLANAHYVVVANAEASRFGCGLVGLKGELAARALEQLAVNPQRLKSLLQSPQGFLAALDKSEPSDAAPPSKGKPKAISNPQVDKVIAIPDSWKQKTHRQRLSYFIPDWDDMVDDAFDFKTETHSGGSGDWGNQVYAHQMFPEPNYDGILISKVVAEAGKKKAERINRLGVHRHLRVPRDFPVMGDCGAFGYIKDYEPPYTTSEILAYYTRLDFDYGVSIDHFAIGDEADRKRRYQLTIDNAEQFLKEHKKLGLQWTPIGAVQGWDEDSFAKAAGQYVKMGYRYIAVGAMVRRRTPEILSIIRQVRKVVPPDVKLHLFGVARLDAINDFADAGVNSADSASWLRKAWLGGAGNNYLTVHGKQYSAIRIPEAEKSFRAKRIVSEGRATIEEVKRLEQACLDSMHRFDRGQISVEAVLDTLHSYDQLITPERQDNRKHLRKTLEDAPWKACPCSICRSSGVDVIIFRGNNRNRRRGFHNTYAFHQLFQRILAGESVSTVAEDDDNQLSLLLESKE
jgi:hypothetical protein